MKVGRRSSGAGPIPAKNVSRSADSLVGSVFHQNKSYRLMLDEDYEEVKESGALSFTVRNLLHVTRPVPLLPVGVLFGFRFSQVSCSYYL